MPWCSKRGVEGEDGALLAAMLGRGRGEDAADLADQRALDPQPAGLVEEVAHLRRHHAEAGRRAEDDGVVVGELVDGRDRRRLVQLEAGLLRHLVRHQLRHALDVDLDAGTAFAPSATAFAIVSRWP